MLPEMESEIYFDNNATTRLIPEVKEEIEKVLNYPFGNPSSPHSFGDFPRSIIGSARNNISKMLNSKADQLVFTSGATESNLSILTNLMHLKHLGKVVITSPSEHASVKANCEYLKLQGYEVIELSLDSEGLINLDELAAFLNERRPALVSIAWANNETGAIQPIEDIARLCLERNVLFHTDASQYLGRGIIDLQKISIDFLSFTGHKLHAPQGIGGLYIKNPESFVSLFRGGEQEHGLRAGTENIIGIAGLGKALELRQKTFQKSINKLQDLRDHFEKKLKTLGGVIINSGNVERVPNTSNVLFKGIDGKALIAQLDIAGVYCSQTSACTSMIPEPSNTLRAMGLSVEDAFSSLRFSFAIDNTIEEVDIAFEIIREKVEMIRKFYEIRGVV